MNKIGRVPALMEFMFWCVGGGEVRNDETQINSCAMCQVVQREKKEEKGRVPGPQSLRCMPLSASWAPHLPGLPPSFKKAGSTAPTALCWDVAFAPVLYPFLLRLPLLMPVSG